jgi:hypothetical protein
MDRDRMSNLYRGPPIDASYQVSVHLAKRFQRRRFKKIGQSETRIACGGHVCKWIGTKLTIFIEDLPWRRLKCEKLKDDRRQVMVKAQVAFGKVS